jgi:hypothetical protein
VLHAESLLLSMTTSRVVEHEVLWSRWVPMTMSILRWRRREDADVPARAEMAEHFTTTG